jgi:hypothetical protein
MSVNLEKGTFYDHEAKFGGGVLDLIESKTGLDHAGAVRWLQGYADRPMRPQPKSKPAPTRSLKTVVATYDYVDENGVLQFQVVRFEPKDFRQCRPGKNGEPIWNLNGVRRVLYRLPELIEAVAATRVLAHPSGQFATVPSASSWGSPAGAGLATIGAMRRPSTVLPWYLAALPTRVTRWRRTRDGSMSRRIYTAADADEQR